jgi:hypothetical protein
MRFREFADPKEYTSHATDAKDSLKHLLPDADGATMPRYEGKQPPIERNKLIGTL